VSQQPTVVMRSGANVGWSASSGQQPPLAPDLGPGVQTNVNGLACTIQDGLGSGSFGAVWLAHTTSGPVAVKEVRAGGAATLDEALFEAQVLRHMSSGPPGLRCPKYVTHDSLGHASGWVVRTAMSRADGIAVDTWLYGVDIGAWKKVDPETYLMRVGGGVTNGVARNHSIASAVQISRKMLLQLLPTFQYLAKLAIHRDVSAHNVLIDPHTLDFTLIDFGLAVDRELWSTGGWQGHKVGGDPRYWCLAAWIAFLRGTRLLDTQAYQVWKHQYIECLDLFSLGVLACELLFHLPSEVPGESGDIERQAFEQARKGWCGYWKYCLEAFQRIWNRGSVEEARGELQTFNFPERNDELMRRLRALLRSLAGGGGEGSALTATLATMLSEKTPATWDTVISGLTPATSPSRSPMATSSVRADSVPRLSAEEFKQHVPEPRGSGTAPRLLHIPPRVPTYEGGEAAPTGNGWNSPSPKEPPRLGGNAAPAPDLAEALRNERNRLAGEDAEVQRQLARMRDAISQRAPGVGLEQIFAELEGSIAGRDSSCHYAFRVVDQVFQTGDSSPDNPSRGESADLTNRVNAVLAGARAARADAVARHGQ